MRATRPFQRPIRHHRRYRRGRRAMRRRISMVKSRSATRLDLGIQDTAAIRAMASTRLDSPPHYFLCCLRNRSQAFRAWKQPTPRSTRPGWYSTRVTTPLPGLQRPLAKCAMLRTVESVRLLSNSFPEQASAPKNNTENNLHSHHSQFSSFAH